MTARKEPKRARNALGVRMNELGASADELAALLGHRYTADEVASWIDVDGDADAPAEARILLRPFLAEDDRAARLALARLRGAVIATLEGDGAAYAGIDGVPYGGGYTGPDGGRPE